MSDKELGKSYKDIPNETNSKWWLDGGLRVNVLHCIGLYFCVFYLGYDASLLNGLQALPSWNEYFDHPSSNLLGLISAALFLPAIITPYISSIVNDYFGRRVALAIGSLLIILGAFINGFAKDVGMFIAGRVLLGAGGPFGKITAIALLQEIAHPRIRVTLASSYYCNYFFGGISAAWMTYASLDWDTWEWQWRVPCLFQIFAPMVVLLFLPFIPESPRWLTKRGRSEESIKILAKYHSNGKTDDPLVVYEQKEIANSLALEEEAKQVRYTDFVRGDPNRRRLLVIVTIGTGTNWIGNGIISYYLAPVLRNVGVSDPRKIAGINGGLQVFNLVFTYIGAFCANRLGRRPLWLTSEIGMLASYIILTALAGSFSNTGHAATGVAVVPFLFIYYGFYDFGWTPLPFSYVAEILPYNLRLRGLAILLSVQSVAQAFNQWVNPVALEAMGWKYYIIYIVLIMVYLTITYLFFPEVKNLTVEEVSRVFDHGRRGDMRAARRALHNEDSTPSDIKKGAQKCSVSEV